jgi:glutathione synthase/RimK-type ligase-like ATP-grasp enzyme
MILILSAKDDEHIYAVTSRLEALGAKYLWFDPARFPAEAELRHSFDRSGLAHCILHYREQEIDFTTITAVWDRRPGWPQAAPEMQNWDHRAWVSQMSGLCLAGIWETLDCLWVPAKPSIDRVAHNKTKQLALAASLGFSIPRTLITNGPESFLEFYSQCEGRMVTKVLGNIVVYQDGETIGAAFTHVVRRRDAANYRAIRYGPLILQEYVSKQVELRVTVVGSRVFAAEIDSQASRATKHDWRHYDNERATYAPHELPPEMETLCLRLVQALGLCYSAIDLVLTPEGKYVFLEINPNGQWGWIEALTDLPIADAITELLVRGTVAPAEGEKNAPKL